MSSVLDRHRVPAATGRVRSGQGHVCTPPAGVQRQEAAVADTLASGANIETIAKSLVTAYEKAAASSSTEAIDEIAHAIDIAIIVGIASVLAGIVLALLIGRSIANPIRAMTDAMGSLAARNMSVEIVGVVLLVIAITMLPKIGPGRLSREEITVASRLVARITQP